MAYQVVSKTESAGTGGGPRVEFSEDGGTIYLTIGAYNGVNNIVNQTGRPLIIQITSGLQIIGLTTAPTGTQTRDLVADSNGKIYLQ